MNQDPDISILTIIFIYCGYLLSAAHCVRKWSKTLSPSQTDNLNHNNCRSSWIFIFCGTMCEKVKQDLESVPDRHERDSKKQTKASTKFSHQRGPGVQEHLAIYVLKKHQNFWWDVFVYCMLWWKWNSSKWMNMSFTSVWTEVSEEATQMLTKQTSSP